MAFPYKAILLDLGGVFFYFDWQRFCNQLALTAPYHDGAQIKKILDAGLLFAYETGNISNDQFFRILKAATRFDYSQETFTNLLADCIPLPKAIALVPRLAQKAQLIAVSNVNEVHARAIAAYPHFAEYFAQMEYSFKLGFSKPDPRFFQTVINKIAVAPQDILFVDDLMVNLQAARGAGVHTLQYRQADDLFRLLDNDIAQHSSLGYT